MYLAVYLCEGGTQGRWGSRRRSSRPRDKSLPSSSTSRLSVPAVAIRPTPARETLSRAMLKVSTHNFLFGIYWRLCGEMLEEVLVPSVVSV